MDANVYNLAMNAISLREAARYIGLSPQTLKVQADRGRLGARRIGGSWVTTIEDVMRYLASRKKNASDVQVICHDCQRVFFTPSESVTVRPTAGLPEVLGCPGCGSPSWGIAAVPSGGAYGHRLEEALRSAAADARDFGLGEAYVNDAVGAYVRVRVLGRSRQRVEFEVDRGGLVDPRDFDRLRDHVEALLGLARAEAGPVPLYRYTFDVVSDAPARRRAVAASRARPKTGTNGR